MSEVTSKLRLILPKTLAVKCGVRPGADVPKAPKGANRAQGGRGWTREDLYERGRSRTR